MNSQRREDPTFVSPIAIDREFPFDYEVARNTHLEVGKWIEDVAKQADDFLAQFVQAFETNHQCSYSRYGIWKEFGMMFQPVQEKTIPHLGVLKRIPMPTLIQEGIVHASDV